MLSDFARETHRPWMAEGLPSGAARPDGRFLALTDAANRAFADGDRVRARTAYAEALVEAEGLFARAGHADVAVTLLGPMALTVACNNLAEFQSRSGETAEARALSLSAAERLMAAAACPSRPMVLRVGCIRQLMHAVRFFHDLTGDEDGTRVLAARAAPVAVEVRRVALAWRAARGDEPRAFDA